MIELENLHVSYCKVQALAAVSLSVPTRQVYAVLGATRTPARERVGLKDDPAQFVAEPDDVARECLDNIANGPVLVPAHLAEAFQMFSSMPRRQAAETMTHLLLSFQK